MVKSVISGRTKLKTLVNIEFARVFTFSFILFWSTLFDHFFDHFTFLSYNRIITQIVSICNRKDTGRVYVFLVFKTKQT